MNLRQSQYLKHNIITSQYTTGNEFIIRTTQEDYVGLYHIVPTGEAWTEDSPKPSSKLLIKKLFDISNDVKTYNKNTNSEASVYVSPMEIRTAIYDRDYTRGYVYRFFCQKRNNPLATIMEISAEQYNTFNSRNNPGINSVVWDRIQIEWSLNKHMAEVLNSSAIKKASINFPGIEKYLTNYLEYCR